MAASATTNASSMTDLIMHDATRFTTRKATISATSTKM